MITTRGRYALQAMLDLAECGRTCADASLTPVPISAIAERQSIAHSYLEQLFCKLRKAGLLNTLRGPRGGYVLAKPPEHITVADILIAVDECLSVPSATHSPSPQSNALDGLWRGLDSGISQYLASHSLADLCNASDSSAIESYQPQKQLRQAHA